MSKHVLTVELDVGQSFTIDPKMDRCYKPNFFAIYAGSYDGKGKKNLLQQLGKMNTAERWFFLYVEERMDHETNIAQIINAELTPTEIGRKTKAFKTLRSNGLMKRIKRENYMINPDIIIPLRKKNNGKDEIYPDLKRMWDALI